jgi:hypothetical protein
MGSISTLTKSNQLIHHDEGRPANIFPRFPVIRLSRSEPDDWKYNQSRPCFGPMIAATLWKQSTTGMSRGASTPELPA